MLRPVRSKRRDGGAGPLPPPRCPACAYDLSGTPGVICPECGGAFDREAVMRARFERPRDEPWPANGLLIAAVLVCGPEIRFGRADWWVQPVIVGAAWAMAAAWVWARRHAILGDKPWLILWLNLVFGSIARIEQEVVQAVGPWAMAAFALGSVAWVGWRSPRGLARALLWIAAVFCWSVGGIYVVGAVFSLAAGGLGGHYEFLGWNWPMGGWNDAIALGAGAVFLALGFLTRWGARRVRGERSPRMAPL